MIMCLVVFPDGPFREVRHQNPITYFATGYLHPFSFLLIAVERRVARVGHKIGHPHPTLVALVDLALSGGEVILTSVVAIVEDVIVVEHKVRVVEDIEYHGGRGNGEEHGG